MNAPIKTTTGSAQLMPRSVISDMAERFGMEKEAFQSTLMKTVMPGGQATNEQVAAFLVVAKEYDLNPFTKEIFAFPAKGGGVQPIVSIDGWLKLINSNPAYDGMEFKDHIEDGELTAITCRIFHKHRSRPIEVTEYLAECKRGTEPWKQWPARMLRHKAVIQCARYAFGFAGIIEPDEYERGGYAPSGGGEDSPIRGSAGLRHALNRGGGEEPQPGDEGGEHGAAGSGAAAEPTPGPGGAPAAAQDGASGAQTQTQAEDQGSSGRRRGAAPPKAEGFGKME